MIGLNDVCANVELPITSGFVSAKFHKVDTSKVKYSHLNIRIISRSRNWHALCTTITFEKIPKEGVNTGDWHLHDPVFTVKTDDVSGVTIPKLANGRFVYSNGEDLLSYVAPTNLGEGGTWIVNRGVAPGTDSGHIHAKASAPELSPVPANESFYKISHWHWLLGSNWVEQHEMSLQCVENAGTDTDVVQQLWWPALGSPQVLLYQVELFISNGGSGKKFYQTEIAVGCNGVTLLLDGSWQSLKDVKVLHDVSPGGGAGSEGWLVHEVSTEESMHRWRILSRHVKKTGTKETYVDAVSIPSSEKLDVPNPVYSSYLYEQDVGHYVWAWLSGPHNGLSLSTQLTLLRCESVGSKVAGKGAFYKMWLADRRGAMNISPLEEDTGLLKSKLNTDNAVLERPHQVRDGSIGSNDVFDVVQWEPIGGKLLHYIEHMLELAPLHQEDDNSQSSSSSNLGVSNCFFYHSRPLVPEPLVYAAELVCLLHGLKPVVMIQYDSPSDKQYRHPFVRALVRAITGVANPGILSHVSTYRSDSTLLLFRPAHKALAMALQPVGQAQALHPVPYPNYNGAQEDISREEDGQIYNSGWNGYVLGYPLHIIDTYCENFHNEMSIGNKRIVATKARREVTSYFSKHGLKRVTGENDDFDGFSRETIELVYEEAYRVASI